MSLRRVLFSHLSFQGGSGAVAVWMLQALLDDEEAIDDVEVLCWRAPDFKALDAFFGTSLAHSRRPRVVTVPRLSRVIDHAPVPLAQLRRVLLLRAARACRSPDQLSVSCENELPVHDGAVSYVHYPAQLRPRPDIERRPWHLGPLLDAYHRATDAMGAAADLTGQHLICNSHWTAGLTRRAHPTASIEVVHPVVPPLSVEPLPMSARARRFVSVGRLSPEKRFEEGIEVVGALRSRGHDVTLTIVGAEDDRAYGREIKDRASTAGCVEVVGTAGRAAYEDRLVQSAFGLHMMREEHFGIAVADLVEAGCVTFAHRSGGPPEIVGNDRCFDDAQDAVERIDAVLRDPAAVARAAEEIAARRGAFGPARFKAAISTVVRSALGA